MILFDRLSYRFPSGDRRVAADESHAETQSEGRREEESHAETQRRREKRRRALRNPGNQEKKSDRFYLPPGFLGSLEIALLPSLCASASLREIHLSLAIQSRHGSLQPDSTSFPRG